MAAGKTTTGKKLAESLNCPFLDLDAYIEEKEGKKIREIFEEKGEAHFRTLEENYLEDVLEENIVNNPGTLEDLPSIDEASEVTTLASRKCTLVLALGGGTVTSSICAQLISDLTFGIYLKADIHTILSRLEKDKGNRPMLELTESIERLFEDREPIYESLARLTI